MNNLYYINPICEVIEKDDGVHVTQLSMITKQKSTMIMQGVDADLIAGWLMAKYMALNRPLVQDAFPTLNSEQCEFLLTGITPQQWTDHVIADEESSD